MLEHERIGDVDLSLDLIIHGVDVSLIDGHALLRQRGGVINRNVLQLRMHRPVLVQDEEQLLSATEGEHGDETPAPKKEINSVQRHWNTRAVPQPTHLSTPSSPPVSYADRPRTFHSLL